MIGCDVDRLGGLVVSDTLYIGIRTNLYIKHSNPHGNFFQQSGWLTWRQIQTIRIGSGIVYDFTWIVLPLEENDPRKILTAQRKQGPVLPPWNITRTTSLIKCPISLRSTRLF
ncbi:hypothetical protein Y032_0648g1108 [Ancylostoma ceylanicum]|uniref:Uncharacterized protein n=1 Tax=Ancylostoma ceylanicum TaxID=53326 RepID=A0A016WK40_9BILA|nr:hypothetical protein Y032_0648g1108 [Ancylostoma ceylanicum]